MSGTTGGRTSSPGSALQWPGRRARERPRLCWVAQGQWGRVVVVVVQQLLVQGWLPRLRQGQGQVLGWGRDAGVWGGNQLQVGMGQGQGWQGQGQGQELGGGEALSAQAEV